MDKHNNFIGPHYPSVKPMKWNPALKATHDQLPQTAFSAGRVLKKRSFIRTITKSFK